MSCIGFGAMGVLSLIVAATGQRESSWRRGHLRPVELTPSQVTESGRGSGTVWQIVDGHWNRGSWRPAERHEWWIHDIGHAGAEASCRLDLGTPRCVAAVRVQSTLLRNFSHIKSLAVELADGSRETFTLAQNGAVHTFSFAPRETMSIKIDLLSTYRDGVGGESPQWSLDSGGLAEVEVLELAQECPQNRELLPACTLGEDGRIGAWMCLPTSQLSGGMITELPGWYEYALVDNAWCSWRLAWDSGTGISVGDAGLYCAFVRNDGDGTVCGRASNAERVWVDGNEVEGGRFELAPGDNLIVLYAAAGGASCFLEPAEHVTQYLASDRWSPGGACPHPRRVFSPGEPVMFGLPECQTEARLPHGARLIGLARCHGADGGETLEGRAELNDGRFMFSDVRPSREGRYAGEITVPALGLTAELDFHCRRPIAQGLTDLDGDGRPDLLRTTWNGKATLIISNDGRFPFNEKSDDTGWSDLLNRAFNVDEEPPIVWNPLRGTWGDFELLVDVDGDGVFDGMRDFYYHAVDVNGDGAPEAEVYNAVGTWMPRSEGVVKTCFNLDGTPPSSYLDFENAGYSLDEQRYVGHSEYLMNVQGSGFFHNGRYSQPIPLRSGWEIPIAWYDFAGTGHNDLIIRCTDVSAGRRLGRYGEFEVAFELNRNNTHERYHSPDMQLTYTAYREGGYPYTGHERHLPYLRGRPDADFIFLEKPELHTETRRQYVPFLDAYKLCMDYPDWEGVYLLFDEDDDDVRWEEMFSPHERGWSSIADHLGDRYEVDPDFSGKGQLYVGKFDGRLHLHGAKDCLWTIDYYGLYHANDRPDTPEGKVPPAGMRIRRVRSFDDNDNGFIDRIVTSSVEYGREDDSEVIEREVSLLDFATPDNAEPDRCELLSPTVDVTLTGFTLEDWDGDPIGLDESPAKAGSDKLRAVHERIADDLWDQAMKLYAVAKELGLNVSEEEPDCSPEALVAYSHERLATLSDYRPGKGYHGLTHARDVRDRYHNGYWLTEKVFDDFLRALPETAHADAMRCYYMGEMERLCDVVRRHIPSPTAPGATSATPRVSNSEPAARAERCSDAVARALAYVGRHLGPAGAYIGLEDDLLAHYRTPYALHVAGCTDRGHR